MPRTFRTTTVYIKLARAGCVFGTSPKNGGEISSAVFFQLFCTHLLDAMASEEHAVGAGGVNNAVAEEHEDVAGCPRKVN